MRSMSLMIPLSIDPIWPSMRKAPVVARLRWRLRSETAPKRPEDHRRDNTGEDGELDTDQDGGKGGGQNDDCRGARGSQAGPEPSRVDDAPRRPQQDAGQGRLR